MRKICLYCLFICMLSCAFFIGIVSAQVDGIITTVCVNDSDCPDLLQFCAKQPGDCEGKGVCIPKPDICTDEYDPVCGCDGNTYSNPCEAAAAGVNIALKGECGIGNECKTNANCLDEVEYCAKVRGNCDGLGVCEERPTICPLIFDPVCGCDGNTYGNACEAAAAGVNVAHKGECGMGNECKTNANCLDEVEYCAKVRGNCDGPGVCEERPTICPLIFDPVCGCDGNTYGNACEAAAAGVNVALKGPCPVSEECLSNENCLDATEFCLKKPGACDSIGMCELRPTGCPKIYAPVCGCDGTTYDNACFAAAAGISIDFTGPCDECIPTAARERGRRCRDEMDNDCDGLIDQSDPDCRRGPKR